MEADPRYRLLGLKAGDSVHEPVGCERCGGTGYRGRTGVFEVLEITDEVRKLIGSQRCGHDQACRDGRHDDHVRGRRQKCRTGVTSAAEVFRVTTAR